MHWTSTNNGAPSSALDLAIDCRNPRILYACAWDRDGGGGGLYRSSDGARPWANISAGMTTTLSSPMALTPNGRRLYVGTGFGDSGGGGVFNTGVR